MKRLAFGFLAAIAFATSPSVAFADGPTLPNKTVTPGATNPAVTQSNIMTTICVSGYTKTIRPPVSYTNKLKISQLGSMPYSKYGSTNKSLFEEDHLIPLELGGNPTDPKNLWPEPWDGNFGAKAKDRLENELHTQVCSGNLELKIAQNAIASNWYQAFQIYVLKNGASVALENSSSSAPQSNSSPSTTSALTNSSPSIPTGATGKCKDGTYSYANTHRGMCSRHGGVAQFYS
jgi:hypothetical protein